MAQVFLELSDLTEFFEVVRIEIGGMAHVEELYVRKGTVTRTTCHRQRCLKFDKDLCMSSGDNNQEIRRVVRRRLPQ